jgi:hypothetical protein
VYLDVCVMYLYILSWYLEFSFFPQIRVFIRPLELFSFLDYEFYLSDFLQLVVFQVLCSFVYSVFCSFQPKLVSLSFHVHVL